MPSATEPVCGLAERGLPALHGCCGCRVEVLVDGARVMAERDQVLLELAHVGAVGDPGGERAVHRHRPVHEHDRVVVDAVEDAPAPDDASLGREPGDGAGARAGARGGARGRSLPPPEL